MQDNRINEIMNFVKEHQESTASISVYRRILGFYPEKINSQTLSDLQKGLENADPDEVETCYYIVK